MSAEVAGVLPLPLGPEEITAQWLTHALSAGRPGVQVRSCRLDDAILGTSSKLRISLEYTSATDLPTRLIVKGGFESHSPGMAWMFLNEARFYRDVAPFVNLNVPETFFVGSDPHSHQSIVIMEDLAERSVRFCNPLAPQNRVEIGRRLRDLATFHAASWNSPEFDRGGRWAWVGTRFSAHSAAYNARFFEPSTWDHYAAMPRATAVSTGLLDREWLKSALGRLDEISAAADQCLIHGDMHLGNLYVDADDRPGFLDMQPARAHWALEVAYHIGVGLDIADRRRWEQDLLRIYLETLAEEGIRPPPFDEAWADYIRFLAYGFFIFLINDVHFQSEAINTANTARMGAAMLDHDTKRLLS